MQKKIMDYEMDIIEELVLNKIDNLTDQDEDNTPEYIDSALSALEKIAFHCKDTLKSMEVLMHVRDYREQYKEGSNAQY